MKKLPLAFFLFTSACGIQSPQGIPRLFSPNGLSVSCNTTTKVYTITFEGLNPENGFSGYNLLYTTSSASAAIGTGTKITLKNALSTIDPTFEVRDGPFFTVSNFTYTLNENQMPDLFFDTPSQYYFMVRAYDRTANLESPSSLSYRADSLP